MAGDCKANSRTWTKRLTKVYQMWTDGRTEQNQMMNKEVIAEKNFD